VIRSTTVGSCDTFGIDVAGTAQVSITAGTVPDYSDGLNAGLAIARESSELSLSGGMLSFLNVGVQAIDSAFLVIRSMTFGTGDPNYQPVQGVMLANGSPQLTMRDVTFNGLVFAIEARDASANVDIDGVKIDNCTMGINIQEEETTPPPVVRINNLTIADAKAYGIDLTGSFDFSFTNSTVSNCQAPAHCLRYGSGPQYQVSACCRNWQQHRRGHSYGRLGCKRFRSWYGSVAWE
jgi:hypothetical protein